MPKGLGRALRGIVAINQDIRLQVGKEIIIDGCWEEGADRSKRIKGVEQASCSTDSHASFSEGLRGVKK